MIIGGIRMDEKRFVRTHIQSYGLGCRIEVWVDMKTGVNYLYNQSGYSGGLTVLLDQNGKPVITSPSQLRED